MTPVDPPYLERALDWIGVDRSAMQQLSVYREWLVREALVAGGIGPREPDRIDQRHLADALLFAGVWDSACSGPVGDLGSGVGMPGIPLAITHPYRQFRLVDRSERRAALLRRAVRVLQLENVEVVRAQAEILDWRHTTVVTRASLPPHDLRSLFDQIGWPVELLVGGSHRAPPVAPGFEVVEIPAEILDRAVWILRMAPT